MVRNVGSSGGDRNFCTSSMGGFTPQYLDCWDCDLTAVPKASTAKMIGCDIMIAFAGNETLQRTSYRVFQGA